MENAEVLERAMEGATAADVRFPRPSFYFAASVLAWVVFWELAERNQQNPHSQAMAWLFVFVAAWVAYTF